MAKKTTTTPQPESAKAKPEKTTKAKVVKEKAATEKAVKEKNAKEKAPAKPKAAAKTTATKKAAKTEVVINHVAQLDDVRRVIPYSRFTDFDIALFQSGKHYKLYEKLGSHVVELNGVVGTYFAVWAPNAHYVSVIANFNGWDKGRIRCIAVGMVQVSGKDIFLM